jgi:peptidoglycan/LPS O-acetylase OafA/YrhL
MGSFIAIAFRSDIQNRNRILALGRVLLPISAAALLILGSIEHGLDSRNPAIQIVGYPIIGIFACCLIVRSIDETSLTARVMTNTALRFYGRYSYGLYVYSVLLHNVLRQYLYPSLGDVLRNQLALNCTYLLICVLLLTLISVASFHLYENRFLRLKRYF